jgi:alpha/beta superfamily hydrolase
MPVPSESALVMEDVFFLSGMNRLHGRLAYPEAGDVWGAVVLAGPQPLLGGTMDNNVVRSLAETLAGQRLLTLRFDYRGVGRSQGPRADVLDNLTQFWQNGRVAGELDLVDDIRAAIACARSAAGADVPIALVGYSFGCVLLAEAQSSVPDRPLLVLIAPTLGKHDYDAYLPLANPLLVIESVGDFASDPALCRAWFDRLCGPKELIRRSCDSHFFRGHEAWLAETVADFLNHCWRHPE